MRAPRRLSPRRRPSPGHLTLLPEEGTNSYGAHPRRPDGRADYRTARTILERNHDPSMATVGGTKIRPQGRGQGARKTVAGLSGTPVSLLLRRRHRSGAVCRLTGTTGRRARHPQLFGVIVHIVLSNVYLRDLHHRYVIVNLVLVSRRQWSR